MKLYEKIRFQELNHINLRLVKTMWKTWNTWDILRRQFWAHLLEGYTSTHGEGWGMRDVAGTARRSGTVNNTAAGQAPTRESQVPRCLCCASLARCARDAALFTATNADLGRPGECHVCKPAQKKQPRQPNNPRKVPKITTKNNQKQFLITTRNGLILHPNRHP